MQATLHPLDWAIIGLYVIFAVVVGALFARRAGEGVQSFFVGDRNLPWWLAGTSIVATTFAADTPLAITGIVATGGIAGNWLWWSWAIAHLCSTFFFARLWRRSGVITDAEITELRYGGRPAAALRGFKALYFGLFINCLTMAWVIKAMVKISQAFFSVPAHWVITVAVLVAVAYTALGGFRSVVATDLVQFALGMIGAVALAYFTAQAFGGLGSLSSRSDDGTASGLLGALEQTVTAAGHSVGDVLDFVPGPEHPSTPLILFLVLLFAGWWRYAEGNGYLVQRLAACRDEGQAQGAALWFSMAHNALRPWPWLVVALAALVVYPQLTRQPAAELTLTCSDATQGRAVPGYLPLEGGGVINIRDLPRPRRVQALEQSGVISPVADEGWQVRFGPFTRSAISELRVDLDGDVTCAAQGLVVQLGDRELAYPLLMGRYLPVGLLGLVIASLLAAFMSTIDTHSNWGASYLVQDLYRRFIDPGASERRAVLVSRLSIVLMATLAGVTALFIENIASVWRFLVMLGAGLGSVSAARWYWSRVTAYAEFAAMGVTTVLALGLQFFCTPTLFGSSNPLFLVEVPGWLQILLIAGASLATWIPVSLWGPREDRAVLDAFAARVRPPGPGWALHRVGEQDPLGPALARFAAGVIAVFGCLFGVGDLVLGATAVGWVEILCAAAALWWIIASGTETKGR